MFIQTFMPRLRTLFFSIAAACTLVAIPAAATTRVRSLPLASIVKESGHILVGSVIDVRSGHDPQGAPATWITLEVSRTLHGPATQRFTFKQFGVAEPLADGTLGRVPGMPEYQVGEEVVLFLRRESGRGFTSPVGLAQGVYRVDREHGAPLVRGSGGPEALDGFLDRVRGLAGPER